MERLTVTIDGNSFLSFIGFYKEAERALTKDLKYRTGGNLDAFNDLLSGGFGVHEYDEPIKLVWTSFQKSREHLGQKMIETILDIIAGHEHIELLTID
ncbi:MAG: RNAse (barnase) inhibitor barstar [Bacteroidia bacterium]